MYGWRPWCAGITEETEGTPKNSNTPAYCLKLPGRKLNLTALQGVNKDDSIRRIV